MEGVQNWFEPILWVIGIIGSLVAFYKLCKPFRDFLQFPKELTKQLTKLDEKVDKHFEQTNGRMDGFGDDLKELKNNLESLDSRLDNNDKGTVALLRDRILQAHRYLMGKEAITQNEYESVVAMFESYRILGGNHFVEKLMEDINTKQIEVSGILPDSLD